MERDFMGLNSVKEEVSDDVSVSAAVPETAKAQGTQRPFGNKNLAGLLVKASPFAASVAGLADSRNKSAGSPAKMTIFYNGTVKVYDSITPEKAQAIMFLAGNASYLVTSDARSGAQVRLPTSKFDTSTTGISLPVIQRFNGQPSSTISSPIHVSSNNGAQSISSSICTNELVIHKSTLNPFSPDCKMDPPTRPITALGSAAAPSMIPRGIPQSRKVSLARFLEKRRERVMNAAPYNSAKKPECTS